MASASGGQQDGERGNADYVAFFNAVEGSGTLSVDANLARAYPAVQLSFSGVYAPEKKIEELLTGFGPAHRESLYVLCVHDAPCPSQTALVTDSRRNHTFFVQRRPEHGLGISTWQESGKTPQNYARNLLCIGADSDM